MAGQQNTKPDLDASLQQARVAVKGLVRSARATLATLTALEEHLDQADGPARTAEGGTANDPEEA